MAATTILSGTLPMPARRVNGASVLHRFSLISRPPLGGEKVLSSYVAC